jgi:hypothetical protein
MIDAVMYGHDADGEDRQLEQRTTGEHVDQRVHAGLSVFGETADLFGDFLVVHTRGGDLRTDPEQDDHRDSEEDLLAQIGIPERR